MTFNQDQIRRNAMATLFNTLYGPLVSEIDKAVEKLYNNELLSNDECEKAYLPIQEDQMFAIKMLTLFDGPYDSDVSASDLAKMDKLMAKYNVKYAE